MDGQIVLDGPVYSLSTVTGCCKFRRLLGPSQEAVSVARYILKTERKSGRPLDPTANLN